MMDLFYLNACNSFRVRRQHFHEFALWTHATLHQMKGSAALSQGHCLAGLADRIGSEVDVLCFDEFAITNVADAVIFMQLLGHLEKRHISVVCTTNRPPEDLYKEGLNRERYLPALVSQLRNAFLVVQVDFGLDYREEAAKASETEATESSGSPEASPEAALAEILGNQEMRLKFEPGEVRLPWNRKLAVPGQANGIARFHFDDLCRKPLGAEDFISVAESFHTVLVHDIPKLTVEEHNEARRFTNLVDVLYEYSVRMICLSPVPVEEVLAAVEGLKEVTGDSMEANSLGVFEKMYDDTPNFQLQIKELGSYETYKELKLKKLKEEERSVVEKLSSMAAISAADGGTGSGWSAAPAAADGSAPQEGVAGVMVAAVGSLQESGFAARRAVSRLREMQTPAYLEAAGRRRQTMVSS